MFYICNSADNEMKDRILEFLRAENKSSAQFAEEIGVQPSGISHILSGRNNPSLDFILKMLEKYKYLSSDWLLFGKGSMYKDNTGMKSLFEQTLFDDPAGRRDEKKSPDKNIPVTPPEQKPESEKRSQEKTVERIVWFFSDGSFEEYIPGR